MTSPSETPSVAGRGLLLAVDGDSLAHRAYHGLPSSIRGVGGQPANALTGFGNFLLRLWESENPVAVVVGWDTLEAPTYRHDALPEYQAGRVFDDAIIEQLAVLPRLAEAFGATCGRAPGFEADDFLAAAAARWDGPVSVVTSDRDAFQLVTDRVTVLQPTKGVSELVRVGPEQVRERYGVDAGQVADFIALRGDPSDKIPGAPGVGPKKAAALLEEFGTLEAVLEAGRFPTIERELRLYRRIATMDPLAPLPSIRPRPLDRSGAAAMARELGLGGLAGRIEGVR